MALTATDRLEEFLRDPGLVPAVVDGNRTRAALSGIDPSEYSEVTGGLTGAAGWPAMCVAAGRRHLDLARRAAATGRTTAGRAWDCLVDGLTVAGEAVETIEVAGPYGSRGLLRHPAGAATSAPLVVVEPGLDSSTAEFAVLADALAARGLATLSLDGPGRGVRSTVTPARAENERVVGAALDAVGSRTLLDLDTESVWSG